VLDEMLVDIFWGGTPKGSFELGEDGQGELALNAILYGMSAAMTAFMA